MWAWVRAKWLRGGSLAWWAAPAAVVVGGRRGSTRVPAPPTTRSDGRRRGHGHLRHTELAPPTRDLVFIAGQAGLDNHFHVVHNPRGESR